MPDHTCLYQFPARNNDACGQFITTQEYYYTVPTQAISNAATIQINGTFVITNATAQPITVFPAYYGDNNNYGSLGGAYINTTASQGICVNFVESANDRARRLEEEKKQRKAEHKAKKLLLSILGIAAFKEFKRRKYIEILGNSGKRYRLRLGGMIEVMKGLTDKVDYKLCVTPTCDMPPTDILISKLLLLTSGKDGENIVETKAIRHAA